MLPLPQWKFKGSHSLEDAAILGFPFPLSGPEALGLSSTAPNKKSLKHNNDNNINNIGDDDNIKTTPFHIEGSSCNSKLISQSASLMKSIVRAMIIVAVTIPVHWLQNAASEHKV